MGWKTSIIIASQRSSTRLASEAIHDATFADRIALALPGNFSFVGKATFEAGAYPSNGNLYIGAYSDAIIIGHIDFAGSCFSGRVPPIIKSIETILPNATSLALQLHSVVNLYGYALFENQTLIRGRAGSADDGVFLDLGEPIAEEQAFFAKSVTNEDGEQVWCEEYDGDVEELDHSCMGEEFVFEVSRRFFGERFDSFDHDRLEMSEYRTKAKPLWHRLLRR